MQRLLSVAPCHRKAATGQERSASRDSSQAADQTTGWALKKYFQRVPANFEKPEKQEVKTRQRQRVSVLLA